MDLRWEGALSAVPVVLERAGQRTEAWPILDTGAVAGLYLCAGFAAAHGLPGTLRELGQSRSGGLGPRRISTVALELPSLAVATYALANVPIYLGDDPANDHVAQGLLGMDVLKRFTLWIDYPHSALHLRPNALFADPLRHDYDSGLWRWLLAGGLALRLTCAAVVRRRRVRSGSPFGRVEYSPVSNPAANAATLDNHSSRSKGS